MLAGADTAAVTRQGGVAGPWNRRLPHFRMEFTPSRGEELQSEYLVPRPRAAEAIGRLRELGPLFDGLLQVTEVRTIAADDLWLSGAYGGDAVGLHFTWVRDVPGVYAVLPADRGRAAARSAPGRTGASASWRPPTGWRRRTPASTTSAPWRTGSTRAASSATCSSSGTCRAGRVGRTL